MNVKEIEELARQYEQQLPDYPAEPWLDDRPVSGYVDHTLLKPEATAAQIKTLCEDALRYQFAAVCINPTYVSLAREVLAGSPVKVATVVGFPLGAMASEAKAFETRLATKQGADEIDMVLAIGRLKGGESAAVLDDVRAVVDAAHEGNAIVKVILEMGLLTRQEKILACLLCQASGAEFVKTSTGFLAGGATVEDVELMRRVIGSTMGVKAAGGVRSLETALQLIDMGVGRIGSTASVRICNEFREKYGA